MTRRLTALGLLLAAAAVYLGLTLPARRARDEARAAFAQQREERERLRAELARLERRVSSAPATPDDSAAAARTLRRSLLAATQGIPIDDVQIASHAERRGSTAARGRLSGTGRQADLLRVAGRLAQAEAGVRLERLELAARPEGIRLDADTSKASGGGS